ncbi:MAG: nucleotide disphospho-sugar-binding domain-containing protein [Planctomycetota bacterium]
MTDGPIDDGSRPLAILSAPGSRGDVNPMVGIGSELRRRGFDVAITLAELYCSIAEEAGLYAKSLIDSARFESVMADPNVWHFVWGMRKVLQSVAAEYAVPHFEWVRSIHRPGRTVLVSHPLDFGSRVFRDFEPSTKLVDIHLAPVMLRTKEDPPQLTPKGIGPGRSRSTFDLMYWIADKLILDPMLGRPLNRLRKQLGLDPVKRIMHQWWLSPDAVVAMYPDWFAPATRSFLPQLCHAGFPLNDASDAGFEVPSDRPVVFTGGTANQHSRAFFELAANACVKLGVAGILLSQHDACFPKRLPNSVRGMNYAPLGRLLPHCRAIVHHGGIGTTSQAIMCGVPQLVRPMAFDQFDNARQVVALNAGQKLPRDQELTRSLGELLANDSVQESVNALARRPDGASGVQRAADLIERVAGHPTGTL